MPDICGKRSAMAMPNFSSLLLVFTLQANQPLTRVNFYFEMKQSFFACTEKTDLEHIMSLMTGLPWSVGQREDALSYGRAHCLQIPRGNVIVDRWEEDFFCVRPRSFRRVCLWVPSELIRNTHLDDGVF
jgi:hypothetical protein